MLSIGIIGLPNVGKSTLFKVLTKKAVDIQNYPFCTIDPNVGVVSVPDERVIKLAEFSLSKKVIPTAIEFVDIAGLIKGAAEGEGLGNKFLSHIREVDAIAEVVRVFKDGSIIHVHNTIDPRNDVDVIEAELILADLETVSKRLATLEKEIKSGDKEATERLSVTEKVKNALGKGESIRDMGLTMEELLLIRDLRLRTAKPIIYVLNISKDNIKAPPELEDKNHVLIDLKTEEELMELQRDEEKEMRKELGVKSGVNELIEESYKLLGIMMYFTTGEDETRAWTIKEGSTAPEAGAAIHTDFRDKFIRAEVINWRDLIDTGSYAKAREKGLFRTEGKNYVVHDGYVGEFKI